MLTMIVSWILLIFFVQIPQCLTTSKGYTVVRSIKEGNDVVAVVERLELIELLYNQAIIGCQHKRISHLQAVYAGFAIMQSAVYLDRPVKRAVQIGLGIGTVPTFLRAHGVITDVVEKSEAVVELATEYFRYERCDRSLESFIASLAEEDEDDEDEICRNGVTLVLDGFEFIHAAPSMPVYDVFIIDVYTGNNPMQFYTKEVFKTVQKNWLKPNGVLVLNFVGFLFGKHVTVPYSIHHTLKTVFPHVKTYSEWGSPVEDLALNIISWASNDPFEFNLPNTGQFENPRKKTYEDTIKSFPEWEVFSYDADKVIEMPVDTKAESPEIFRRTDWGDAYIISNSNDHYDKFAEAHRYTQDHMRERVKRMFPASLWIELGVEEAGAK